MWRIFFMCKWFSVWNNMKEIFMCKWFSVLLKHEVLIQAQDVCKKTFAGKHPDIRVVLLMCVDMQLGFYAWMQFC